MSLVTCPVCSRDIGITAINRHLDSGCTYQDPAAVLSSAQSAAKSEKPFASIFATPAKKHSQPFQDSGPPASPTSTPQKHHAGAPSTPAKQSASIAKTFSIGQPKRSFNEDSGDEPEPAPPPPPSKRQKAAAVLRDAMPLAEKMRPQTLDDVCGQDLVGKGGVLRGLIEEGRVPSMILWGSAGCGKTTIARVIAHVSDSRFVEISATSSGVQEFKKIFQEARGELLLTGRKTILFCDEIHRLNKTQQDQFLGPVENGQITL
jgi:putative ATPase